MKPGELRLVEHEQSSDPVGLTAKAHLRAVAVTMGLMAAALMREDKAGQALGQFDQSPLKERLVATWNLILRAMKLVVATKSPITGL